MNPYLHNVVEFTGDFVLDISNDVSSVIAHNPEVVMKLKQIIMTHGFKVETCVEHGDTLVLSSSKHHYHRSVLKEITTIYRNAYESLQTLRGDHGSPYNDGFSDDELIPDPHTPSLFLKQMEMSIFCYNPIVESSGSYGVTIQVNKKDVRVVEHTRSTHHMVNNKWLSVYHDDRECMVTGFALCDKSAHYHLVDLDRMHNSTVSHEHLLSLTRNELIPSLYLTIDKDDVLEWSKSSYSTRSKIPCFANCYIEKDLSLEVYSNVINRPLTTLNNFISLTYGIGHIDTEILLKSLKKIINGSVTFINPYDSTVHEESTNSLVSHAKHYYDSFISSLTKDTNDSDYVVVYSITRDTPESLGQPIASMVGDRDALPLLLYPMTKEEYMLFKLNMETPCLVIHNKGIVDE